MNIVFITEIDKNFNELQEFPKLLLPTEHYNSLLEETITKFPNNDFYIITDNTKLFNNYISVNNLKENLKLKSINLIDCQKSNRSLNTIISVADQLLKQDILFINADITIDSDVDIISIIENYKDISNNGIIFVSDNEQYRYNYDGLNISEDSSTHGNVMGMFYIKKLPDFNNDITKFFNESTHYIEDLVQYEILKGITFSKVLLPNIIDYKNLDEYKNRLSKEYPYKHITNNDLEKINNHIEHSKFINVEIDDFVQDLYIELKDSIIEKCDDISNILICYNKDTLIEMIETSLKILLQLYSGKTHVKYIQPLNNEKFGLSSYSWNMYEYAKQIKSFLEIIDLDNKMIFCKDCPILKNDWNNYIELESNTNINEDIIQIIIGLLYIKSAFDYRNDIMKANIVYNYGLSFISEICLTYNLFS